jgi:hypothetical protein
MGTVEYRRVTSSCYADVMRLALSRRPQDIYELSAMSAEGQDKTAERKGRNDRVGQRFPNGS